MIKNDNFYCDRCGEDVSEKSHVTLIQDFSNMPGEILDDNFDLCRKCWPGAKQFLSRRAVFEGEPRPKPSNVFYLKGRVRL